MNPEQPNYNFIIQGSSGSPKMMRPKTQKDRIILVSYIAVSIMLLIIVGTVVYNMFSTNYSEKLTDLAASQNEIERVMLLGAEGAKSSTVVSYAQTAAATVASQKRQTIALATKKGIKITDKKLASTKSTKIDDKLTAASSTNSFDETFLGIYEEQLAFYQKKLADFSSSESNENIKSSLVEFTNQIPLLSSNYKTK